MIAPENISRVDGANVARADKRSDDRHRASAIVVRRRTPFLTVSIPAYSLGDLRNVLVLYRRRVAYLTTPPLLYIHFNGNHRSAIRAVLGNPPFIRVSFWSRSRSSSSRCRARCRSWESRCSGSGHFEWNRVMKTSTSRRCDRPRVFLSWVPERREGTPLTRHAQIGELDVARVTRRVLSSVASYIATTSPCLTLWCRETSLSSAEFIRPAMTLVSNGVDHGTPLMDDAML